MVAAVLDSHDTALELRHNLLSLRNNCLSILSTLCQRARSGSLKGLGSAAEPWTQALTVHDPTGSNTAAAGGAVPVALALNCVEVLRNAATSQSAPVTTWPLAAHHEFMGCVPLRRVRM